MPTPEFKPTNLRPRNCSETSGYRLVRITRYNTLYSNVTSILEKKSVYFILKKDIFTSKNYFRSEHLAPPL